MMMFETLKHVPKTEKRCCVFENNRFICANKTIFKVILTVTIRSHRVQLCKRSHSCIRCGHSLITQEFPVIVSPYLFAQLTFTIMSNHPVLFVTQHNNNTLPTILGESLAEETN